MRKSPLSRSEAEPRPVLDTWLDIAHIAAAEITSEEPAHPFEDTLAEHTTEGWRAAAPGPQTIRLRFDHPINLRRIRLEFRESERERSQEFTLSAINSAQEKREVARQQWNFSPTGSTIEVEDYSLKLTDVVALELHIDPGRHNKEAIATLQSLAIA